MANQPYIREYIRKKRNSMNDQIEKIAECIWQSESVRATGTVRRVLWDEVSDKDKAAYRFTATNVYHLMKG